MKISINIDEFKNINLLGEILRAKAFEHKFDDNNSPLLGGYHHFDVSYSWKELNYMNCTSAQRNILATCLRLLPEELSKATIYKNHEDIIMAFHYDKLGGTLLFLLPDKRVIISKDCSVDNDWSINTDFLFDNVNQIDIIKALDLIKVINHADLTNNQTFSKIIKASSHILDLSDLEMAELCKTSVPTIKRWKSGETFPHMLIKKGCVKTLLKEIEAKI